MHLPTAFHVAYRASALNFSFVPNYILHSQRAEFHRDVVFHFRFSFFATRHQIESPSNWLVTHLYMLPRKWLIWLDYLLAKTTYLLVTVSPPKAAETWHSKRQSPEMFRRHKRPLPRKCPNISRCSLAFIRHWKVWNCALCCNTVRVCLRLRWATYCPQF